MSRKSILSIAVVTMFVFTAFSIVAISDSSDTDADSANSSYVYVKFDNVSQADFEKVFDSDNYVYLLNAESILSNLFSSYCIDTTYASYEFKYDTISIEYSKSSKMDGTHQYEGGANKISVSNLTITITVNSEPSSVYPTSSMYKDFNEVISYLGEKPVAKDSKIVLHTQSYKLSTSERENTDYSTVKDSTKYVVSGSSAQMSTYQDYEFDVTIGDKTLKVASDASLKTNTKTSYSFLDPERKKDSTYSFVSDIDYSTAGDLTLTEGTRKHKADQTDMLSMFAMMYNGVTQVSKISLFNMEDLPTVEELKYNEMFTKLSSDNSVASNEIKAAGGTCDQTENSAEKLISDVYDSTQYEILSGNNFSITFMLLGVVAAVLILVIFAVVMKRKTR